MAITPEKDSRNRPFLDPATLTIRRYLGYDPKTQTQQDQSVTQTLRTRSSIDQPIAQQVEPCHLIIRAIFKRSGLRLSEASALANLPKVLISQYFSGRDSIDLTKALRLAHVVGATDRDFLRIVRSAICTPPKKPRPKPTPAPASAPGENSATPAPDSPAVAGPACAGPVRDPNQ